MHYYGHWYWTFFISLPIDSWKLPPYIMPTKWDVNVEVIGSRLSAG